MVCLSSICIYVDLAWTFITYHLSNYNRVPCDLCIGFYPSKLCNTLKSMSLKHTSDYIMLEKKSSPNNFYSRRIICHDLLHILFIIWTDFLFPFLHTHTHTHTHRWRTEGTISLHTAVCPYRFLSRDRLSFISWLEYIMHLDLTLILLTEGGVF